MTDLQRLLSGGDRRSIGAANQVVPMVLAEPALVAQVFAGFTSDDPVVRMRCADVAEKVTALQPELLQPYKRELLNEFALIEQKEVRWHIAIMLPRLALTRREEKKVLGILRSYCEDSSSIVKTMAMQAMADLCLKNPALQNAVVHQLNELMQTGTPAMLARGKKLLALLARQRG